MSQRHVSGECNAGYREEKKIRKKENKEPNQGCGFPGMEIGQPAHLSTGQLQHPWKTPVRTLVFPCGGVTAGDRANP